MFKKLGRLSAAFVVAGGIGYAEMQQAQAKGCQVGEASWYGPGFNGNLTANGERFDQNELTAAHRTISNKKNRHVEVTNLNNGRTVVVRINDYGPHAKTGRVIDLSKAAAGRLNMIQAGTARVRVCPL